MKLRRDVVSRSNRSHFIGNDSDLRFKNIIVSAFGSTKNDSLEKVCQDIASHAQKAYQPKVTNVKTS